MILFVMKREHLEISINLLSGEQINVANWTDAQKERNHSFELKEYSRSGWCRNLCRASVTCTPKEFVTMSRCFWEERLLGVSIYKNDELLIHQVLT
jgi:hypothetical protein